MAANPGTREAYQRIRNYLAGRMLGATRDQVLVEQLVCCLFCRAALDAGEGRPADRSEPERVAAAYRAALARLRRRLPEVFDDGAELELAPEAIAFIDAQLDGLDFRDPARDPIGDAYEVFMGAAARGAAGQFFTPRNAVRLLVELVAPAPGETIIDPACGAGGFLSFAARDLLARGATAEQVSASLFGIDKDRYLVRLARAHVALATLSSAQIHCGDSLAWCAESGQPLDLGRPDSGFDVVLANPPFGAKIVAASDEVRGRFELAHRFRQRDGAWVRTDALRRSSPPQVLFLERCLALARPGGRVGMVVPESLVSSPSHRYVVEHIHAHAELEAVIGMPEELFKTSGKGGTHTKTCLLLLTKRPLAKRGAAKLVFMAEARFCGHDSRGRATERDDLPEIGRRYRALRQRQPLPDDQLGYGVAAADLRAQTLAPRYHDPAVRRELDALAKTHELVSIAALEDAGVLEIKTGDEVGKLAYGTGDVPFVRTSDLSNWEIKLDPKHCVSAEVHARFAAKQDVREADILMVRDGTYLIGTCAYVTRYDTRIVFQSHLYKLRVVARGRLSPELLLALLSSAPVRRQIRAKRATQDIIDSLGDRLRELVLPIPRDAATRERITDMVARVIRDRVEARELARRAALEVVDPALAGGESDA